MIRFVARRLALLVPVLFGVSLLVFAMMALLPGDQALAILGPYATAERAAQLRQTLALDRSLPAQYLTWIWHLCHGDFGRSYSLNRPVADVLLERTGPTALLSVTALGFGTLLGLIMGAAAAARAGSWRDRALTALSLVGISTPAFWLAMLVMLVFGVGAGWFPVSGWAAAFGSGAGGVLDVLHHLALPAFALGLVPAGVIARMMRAEMLEAMSQDFVRTARAKGLDEGTVVYRHAFRAALAAVVPVIGLQAGFVLGGAIYIETVFQWPGLGRMLVEAIGTRDLLLVQGGVVVVATAYVIVNLLTDLAHHALDPRLLP